MEEKLEEGASYYILGTSEYDLCHAEFLADAYLEDIAGKGFPAYRDFSDTEEEKAGADAQEEFDTINEFDGFFKTWRERVIAIIESQIGKKG